MAEKINDGGPARPRHDPMDWFRAQYSVPAKKGGRIEYTGDRKSGAKLGTITGTQGPRLLIRLDGEKHSNPYHPTWELRYLDAAATRSSNMRAEA